MQQEINNEEPEMDLLGNDLFLIVETHEELINSLIGHYSYIIFNLQKRNKANDFSLINEYQNKMDILSDLKLELAIRNHDIDFKKHTILALENELKTLQNAKNDIVAEEFPKERYNILNGSIPLTEEEKALLDQNSKRMSEFFKKKLNLKD